MMMENNLKNIIDSVDRKMHRNHIRVVGANKQRDFEMNQRPETIWHMKHIPYKTQDRGGKNENEEDVL